jgi:hypothetical protein
LVTTDSYTQLNFRACCVVLSRDGRVLFSLCSEEMQRRGWAWIDSIPAASLTARLLAGQAGGSTTRVHGKLGADAWFGGWPPDPLQEEVKVLGGSGLVLTYLALEEGQAPLDEAER